MPDRSKRGDVAAPAVGTSLADVLAKRGVSVTPAAPPVVAAAGDLDLSRVAKVVVRRERKGRGGKMATVVEGLGLRASQLERVARELKRGLGCGATVEDDAIVLQGDLASRVEPWLTARGVHKVVVGN